MARPSTWTRSWRRVYAAWCPKILLGGADTLSGWSMHTTPCPVLLLVSLPSIVPMVTNHRCFQFWRRRSACHQPKPSFDGAAGSGRQPVKFCSVARLDLRGQQIAGELQLLRTDPGKRCGCQLRIFLWGLNLVCLLLALLALFLSLRWWIRQPLDSSSPDPWGFTQRSMYVG